MSVCLPVRLSKHFLLWSSNSWSDRDGRTIIRCVGTAKRRWYRFRPIGCTWHVPRAIALTIAKKVVAQDADQTNGRIRLKLCMSIAKLDGQLRLGNQQWCHLGTCLWHVPSDFINSFIATQTEGPIGAGRTPFDSDRRRQDYLINCRGDVGSNPNNAGKIKSLRF